MAEQGRSLEMGMLKTSEVQIPEDFGCWCGFPSILEILYWAPNTGEMWSW